MDTSSGAFLYTYGPLDTHVAVPASPTLSLVACFRWSALPLGQSLQKVHTLFGFTYNANSASTLVVPHVQ